MGAQGIVGFAVLAVVMAVAFVISLQQAGTQKGVDRAMAVAFRFFGNVVLCYAVLGFIGGFFWVMAWIGIMLREILQWLVVTVLYPLNFINPF